jgi:hypothetical protein
MKKQSKSLKSLKLNKHAISNLQTEDLSGGVDEGTIDRISRFNHLCDLFSRGPGCRSTPTHCPTEH